jgi:DNA-binding beta-propeller fold protein YncE
MNYRLPLGAALIALSALNAQAQSCNGPGPAASVTIPLPGSPFGVVPSQDGCWLFVSVGGGAAASGPGVAVLKRAAGKIELVRVVRVASAPAGMVLTHDGKLLAAAAGSRVVFLDVARMTAGGGDPVLGSMEEPGVFRGSIYVNVTADDKTLFVSEEGGGAITVIDLERARKEGYRAGAIIGAAPTGMAPIALTFSPDGKWLYTTSEGAPPDWKWPAACTREGSGDPAIVEPEGAVVVVDVERARKNPVDSIAARVPAGCSPVRADISPKGDRLFVAARNSNAVVAFDAAKLVSDGAHARIAVIPVGPAPVPVAVIDGGTKVVAGNSNRFAAPNAPQTLTVLDAGKLQSGAGAVLGTVQAGAFPREMRVSADGNTLFFTNAGSNSLQVLDVKHLPFLPVR